MERFSLVELFESIHLKTPLGNGNLIQALITLYFREAKQFRLLKRSEQVALGWLVQEIGDEEARNKLVEHNLLLAAWIARRYLGRGMEYLDLIQEGNLGLLRAAELYDHKKGTSFTTYSVWWIRQAIVSALYNYAQSIRIPVREHQWWNKLIRESAQLVRALGREPTLEEIAQALQVEEEIVSKTLRRMKLAKSAHFDDLLPLSEPGEEDHERIGALADKSSLSPEQVVEAKELMVATCRKIRETLNLLNSCPSLSKRDVKIFCLRHGLDGTLEPRTLEEVGREFNLTRERARQILEEVAGVLGAERENQILVELRRLHLLLDLLGEEAVQIVRTELPWSDFDRAPHTEDLPESEEQTYATFASKNGKANSILRAVCLSRCVGLREFMSHKIEKQLVRSRHIAAYLLRHDLKLTYEEVGHAMRKTGVAGQYGYMRIQSELKADRNLAREIGSIRAIYWEEIRAEDPK